MLSFAPHAGPAYNSPTPAPVGHQTNAIAQLTRGLTGLGNRRISPVPGCVNCVAGVNGASTGLSTGVLVVGALAVLAAGYAIYSMRK